MTYREMLHIPVSEYLTLLEQTILGDIPEDLATTDNMGSAATLLATLSNEYSMLMCLLSYAKTMARELKRSGPKEDYEDMVDRKEITQNFADALKLQYQATSRAVTVWQESNAELRMNTSGAIYERSKK